MLKRTLIGATVLAVVLGAWWFDSSRPGSPAWALAGLGAVLVLGSLHEVLVMGGSRAGKRQAGLAAGVLWVALLFAAGWQRGGGALPDALAGWLQPASLVLAGASALASLALLAQLRNGPGRGAESLARSPWFGVPYAGGVACLLPLLLEGRLDLVLGLVLVSKSSDIGAYFAGKSFGKHKLAPSISPGKTREGLVGGLLLPAVVAVFLLGDVALSGSGDTARLVPGGWWGAALHGLVLAVVTVLSDLGESLLKRSCSVKDSGTLFGEAGGFLDLADSLLLVGPLALAYTSLPI